MISEKLQQAREYEKENFSLVPEKERPRYHVTAPIGWINDPNGFSTYKGEYHLFFQYHPYSTNWGPMHWGHVKTVDFVKWESLPVAMAPDTKYDDMGCFSGSAITLPDGRHLLMYTSVEKRTNNEHKSCDYQQQSVATGDGKDYVKYPDNPVITTDMIPQKNNKVDFRDPKIWEEDGRYYCIVGSRSEDDSGELVLFESSDCFNWEYKTVVDRCCNEYGKMWECPDYFPLDNKQILIVSPQEMEGDGAEFHPGNGTVLFVGKKNADISFKREDVQTLDFGLDFYAPQTLLAKDNRRIMIAWMQNWDTSGIGNGKRKIYGQMTFPRELTIKGKRVYQNPVREIEAYYGTKVIYSNLKISKETALTGITGRVMDITVTLDVGANPTFDWFEIKLSKGEKHFTSLSYDTNRNTFKIDRSRSGGVNDILNSREFNVASVNDKLKIRLLLDRYSVEVFLNDGEKTASTVIYTPLEEDEMTFCAGGTARVDIEKNELLL